MSQASELLSQLESENLVLRIQAVTKLGAFKDEKVVKALIKALKDDVSKVRKYAAIALGHIGDEKAIDPLTKVTKHSDSETRLGAIQGLADFKTDKVLKCLKGLARDDNILVRVTLFEKLGTFPAEKTVDFFIDEFKEQKSRIKSKIIEILEAHHAVMTQGQIEKVRKMLEPFIDARIRDLSDFKYAGEDLGVEFTVSDVAVDVLEKTFYYFTDYQLALLKGLLNREERTRNQAKRVLQMREEWQDEK